MRDFNFVITNENYEKNKGLLDILFGDEPIIEVSPEKDMYDLVVMAKLFTSRSEAKKNWGRSGRKIGPGFREFKYLGKYYTRITIFNPKAD